jgi:glycosyltransferase involved in cell wall biosynthesis
VVATRVGGIPEVVTDSAAGVLLESGTTDSVVAGVRALLERHPDPERVREFALRFGWGPTTEGQLAIFRQLAAGAARTPQPQARGAGA